MPLPLPDLDTRRWDDLVDEGRAQIPRYAPAWTDHNIHDPGITLVELVAWLTEGDIYRANWVPARHRRKFLELIGHTPRQPRPARVAVAFRLALAAAPVALPEGVVIAADGADGTPLPFRLLAGLTVSAIGVQSVVTDDGTEPADRTRDWRAGVPFLAWGTNPAASGAEDTDPALYIVLDDQLQAGVPVSFWITVAGDRTGPDERARIADAATRCVDPCLRRPVGTCDEPDCAPSAHCRQFELDEEPLEAEFTIPEPETTPAHDAVAAWEYFAGGAWQPLDGPSGSLLDETRSLTLDGRVVVTPPAPSDPVPSGIAAGQHAIRCRLASGRPDAAPRIAELSINAVEAEQSWTARTDLVIVPGTVPSGPAPTVGFTRIAGLGLDAARRVTSLTIDFAADTPDVLVLAYEAATATTPGFLTVGADVLGPGTAAPGQRLDLASAPIAGGSLTAWSVGSGVGTTGHLRSDLDAARRTDAVAVLDATSGALAFGDGERGRVLPADAVVLAAYRATRGAAAALRPGAAWRLLGADDAMNTMLLTDVEAAAAAIGEISNRREPWSGSDEESLEVAAGRAVARLWAHERLIGLLGPGSLTLDQIDRASVTGLVAPSRATTLADFERLALDVPGTNVARARAWSSLDPRYPCLEASGTVTVVVIPWLPIGRPEPTPGLLGAVGRYLDARRVLCTRLFVVGPTYLEVAIRASIVVRTGADPDRVRADVTKAVDAFFDPLSGGPDGRGWPFGRDVYRTEVLQVIGRVEGVDHVVGLELVTVDGGPDCDDICVGPTTLVQSGQHAIELVRE
ncbi:MAG TPA: baseplate J/gp47 family protein [Candidatus Limnocylindrales bacterium]|nr:baseplate J/gp47 family protein [Candidatus Limnocylindrales bacterium]